MYSSSGLSTDVFFLIKRIQTRAHVARPQRHTTKDYVGYTRRFRVTCVSRHSARGINLICFPVSHVYFFGGGGTKSIAKLDGGPWPDFLPPGSATVSCH